MENDNTGASSAPEKSTPPVDEIKNLKAEFNRKLDNQNAQMQQLLASLKAPNTQPQSKKVSVFEDEDAYAQRISQETEERINSRLEENQKKQAKYQTVVNQIVQDYPEANDSSSALYTRAQEIYKTLPEEEQMSPLAMKAAVSSAAAELGLKPKSKRSASNTDEENFSMGSSTRSTSGKSRRDGDLNDATLEFAARLGQDINNPEYIKKLKETAKRSDWKRYR